MTRKTLLLLSFTCLYLFALGTGYSYAKTSRAAPTLAEVSPFPTASPSLPQSTWVVVRVDDMTFETPHLVSVWAMILYHSPDPQVFFKSVFSNERNNPRSSNLARKFGVNPDRTLNGQFLKELDQLDLNRSGLVILDNESFQNFTTWFDLSSTSRQTPTTIPLLWHANRTISEVQSYQHICIVLQTPNHGNHVTLRWQELAANHFILIPGLDPYAGLWDKLIASSSPANCEVLVEP